MAPGAWLRMQGGEVIHRVKAVNFGAGRGASMQRLEGATGVGGPKERGLAESPPLLPLHLSRV